MTGRLRAFVVLAVVALTWTASASPASAVDPIVLDSVFTDWSGEANITDTNTGNCAEDISAFWWADNSNEDFAYWRVDRPTCSNKDVTYVVYVDTNNNGTFTENVDREVVVDYDGLAASSDVGVTVRFADTDATISQLLAQDLGESDAEGARSVEFRASFADLGIVANQTIRMYVESFRYQAPQSKDLAPDTGDIQWSPVNVLGYATLAALGLIGIGLVWWFRGRRIWQPR